MKRFFLLLFSAIIVFSLLACCFACKDQPSEQKKVTVHYYDGETLIYSQEYTESFSLPTYPKEGFDFFGWFLDENLTTVFSEESIPALFEDGSEITSLTLYAKTAKKQQEPQQNPKEEIMNDFELSIIGEAGDRLVLNPAFFWKEETADTSYDVTLFKGSRTVTTLETTKKEFQHSSQLNKNSEYKLQVVGKQSGRKSTLSFRTLGTYSNSVTSVTLVNPYSDKMVIQRNKDAVISGTAPVDQVISLSVGEERYYALSDASGAFSITMPAREASFTPVNLVIGNGTDCNKTISDVLFGDVYLFAGQSNMQWPTKDSDCTQSDIENLKNSYVRFFAQDVVKSSTKLKYVKNGRWFIPDENKVNYFSAIATMTGSLLGEALKQKTPIGIVTAYQGDTNIANWMGEEYYDGTVSTKNQHYNAMVYPLRHTNLTGVVWYQGCNNSGAGCDYKDLLATLFRNYRDLFNNESLPFYVIGLACFNGDRGNNFDFSFVRESQAKACAADENAYFISTCDDGDPGYIHPKNKHYICERVAKSIGASLYGDDCYTEGPSYKSHSVSGNTVTIELNNAEGLTAKGEITGMLLAGADGKYHAATASIVNGKIVASSAKVPSPVYVKYGFGKSPFVNIYNKDGFVITPFRTDLYNLNIDLLEYDDTDLYTYHPDGATMQVSAADDVLTVVKGSDVGFGSVRLSKWGAIAYHPEAFRFSYSGTGSGAKISFRFVEGSYETWGYSVTDDSVGERTVSIPVEEIEVTYSQSNSIFEVQKIMYIEIMIECEGELPLAFREARFVPAE